MSLPIIQPRAFESIVADRKVDLYTLSSPTGITTQITNFGARVVNLFVPDRRGRMGNVVLGFSSLDQYLGAKERFYGASIGRFANRIDGGRFTLDGITYQLTTNEGSNHLHGGAKGFDQIVWDARQVDGRTLVLTNTSRRLEEGYPGALSVRIRYRITTPQTLEIDYQASTDAPTIINLTHHSYFNLAGPGSGPVADHALQILADEYLPIDEHLIPTGEIAGVEGTPMDFRIPKRIGDEVDSDFHQLHLGRGFDHNWVLRPAAGPTRPAARVYEPTSGRILEVLTTEPGLQFYGGNFFDGTDIGASGEQHRYREAFALETQHFPDSPNKPDFPATVLRPGETYRSRCVYRFYATNE